MKISINPPDDKHFSIMQRILDNRLTIESPEEFNDILAIYQDDPFLHRKYADLLVSLKRRRDAVAPYAKSAQLFIDRGMNLQAIVSKILQWSLEKPTHDQGRDFHALLHEAGSRQTPLQRFWSNMTYGELIAVMRSLVRVRHHASERLTQLDAPAEDLYFIVFGTVVEMPSPDCEVEAQRAGVEIEPSLLGPNDIFGDVFPLLKETTADTEIRSVTDVELVKISKPTLKTLCQKHPKIETLLTNIFKPENREKCDRTWQTVRRAIRYGLPTKVALSFSTAKKLEAGLTGIAIDLSLSGMRVELEQPLSQAAGSKLKGNWVYVRLILLSDVMVLNLTGKIVWQKRYLKNKRPVTMIGVHFDTLNAMDRDMLSQYCSGNVGEQNLLWSLWESKLNSDDDK